MANDNILREFAQTGTKLVNGYSNLVQIDNVDVATTPKELVYKVDKVKLYRYTRSTPAKFKTPLVISYALVNRHDMLDLQPDRSFIKNLLELGLDIYIIDWGYPTRADKDVTMASVSGVRSRRRKRPKPGPSSARTRL